MHSIVRGIGLITKPTLTSTTISRISRYGLQSCRLLRTKGALGGGFTKEGLEQYAKQLWQQPEQKEKQEEKEDVIQTDMYSTKLSISCSNWLNQHDIDTSSQLANSYFGSKQFFVERIILSFILPSTHPQNNTITTVPETFHLHDNFLVWKVTSKTPLELICSWEKGNFKGLTMFGFSPQTRRLYHGNCISFHPTILSSQPTKIFFHLMNQFHIFYAKQLLHGMATSLEHKYTKHSK